MDITRLTGLGGGERFEQFLLTEMVPRCATVNTLVVVTRRAV
jgi:hypothetical protein